MLSVKLLVLDALINNLIAVLCREDASVFFDSYSEMLDRLLRARRALCGR